MNKEDLQTIAIISLIIAAIIWAVANFWSQTINAILAIWNWMPESIHQILEIAVVIAVLISIGVMVYEYWKNKHA
ncbi:MAG: hypothetical protein WCX64_06080 [Candidatus Micrarchaeia archaeon]